mgnify:CR=1 FL=1
MQLRIGTILVAMLLGMLMTAPAHAETPPGPPESYLFVVDGARVTILPGKDDAARIVIRAPEATRFSDRPYRHDMAMSVTDMLEEFGWSPQTQRLAADTPNAAVSVRGRSQIVDIRKAWTFPDRLVLSVRGLDGPVSAAAGRGSIFIDNVTTYPVTQTLSLGGDYSATVALSSATSTSVEISSPGWAFPGIPTLSTAGPTSITMQQYNGGAQELVTVTLSATFTANSVTVMITGTATPSDATTGVVDLYGIATFTL